MCTKISCVLRLISHFFLFGIVSARANVEPDQLASHKDSSYSYSVLIMLNTVGLSGKKCRLG